MISHRFSIGWGSGSSGISKSFELSSGSEVNIDETIADGASNSAVAFSADVSQIKGLFMVSDQDILVETNDGTSPANTFSLSAGKPFLWITGGSALRDTAGTAVSTDITGIFVTNASGASANLQIRTLIDPTV